ncbi:hypothetical protein [Actinocorallia herbida]|nr:hypothetical protein [Actinocorallia herbida]
MKRLIPRRADRTAAGAWLTAALAVAWFSIVAIRVIPHDGPWPDYLTRWNRWDADRFWWLATYGYSGGPPDVYDPESWPAFFPGYPLVIRFVGLVVSDYRAAGLLISLLAGPVVAIALSRLTDLPTSTPTFLRHRIGAPPSRTSALDGSSERAPGSGRTRDHAGKHPSDRAGGATERTSGFVAGRDRDHAAEWIPDRGAEHASSGSGRASGFGAESAAERASGGVSGRVGERTAEFGAVGVGTERPGSAGAAERRRGATAPGGADLDAGTEERPEAWWGRPGFLAVLAIITSPCAVFLFAAYSEALFLALALPAWLLAKKGRWEYAALLAAAASVVRITGLFLALAMIVEFLVGPHGRKARNWRKAPFLIAPFVSIAAYMGYLWYETGDMMAWQHAQEKGWNRQTVMPWESFKTTWVNAFQIQSEWTNAFRVEIAAAAVGVLLVAWLLHQRQWPEFVYVATQLAAFMTSSFYLSIGRATLLWFPLWIVLGHLMSRHRWLLAVYLSISLPLMVAFTASFTQGQWTG